MNQINNMQKFYNRCDYIIENLKEYLAEVKSKIKEVEVDDIDLENVVLIDVREEDEFASGIIPANTIFTIPRGKLEFSLQTILPYIDKEIVCYCLKGARGALATKTLNDLGINAKNLKGGIESWVKAKKPIKNYLGVFVES
ncbi:rhodanese-like domain-containing protein [Caminibacter mediatlanticus]|uniref:Rhodanese/MoeB/ThiF domain protein n=1 Tax=Caminibacter mediatlanticus TB-2 TaxID=391592 RepID=A0AAI9AG49_9BACT|nr:rhodanese-like domain-containing protein [Caminibacter mediatlanticus]EDM23008.1 rhodanese/MoeB/ThiF domain protein [Caminibacter mediatlanticus TB-2]